MSETLKSAEQIASDSLTTSLLNLVNQINWLKEQIKINLYLRNGRKPWSRGYSIFKKNFITQSLDDPALVKLFEENLKLPDRYGEFLDDRVVEFPWLISRLNKENGTILDAGSALNFDWILQHAKISDKDITIVTLEPERNCYWQNRVSYLFGDLRNLPIKDNWFDEIVSISTIEHIGMNNSIYSSDSKYVEQNNLDYLKVISELKRVTKPGGKVYITVPYGKYTDFGWYQQFNGEMIDAIIETFEPAKLTETYYCYEFGGWSIGDKQYCQKFEGFNIRDTKYFNPHSNKDYDLDRAAASRAVAALELWK
ncbi:MAG: methyltransferase domain-containing protein [Prochloraceae cyanobacterium]|nr:methyltransferase domain-containing protein [Prochloraceae cyanobacterium]